ncbi:MAG: hypothetical protein HN353_05915 [Bdellovibrionales bacterium]|nr:hypothetical protein [Bdellovibrionales bacterium]MBT3527073.1 hypothetical protein [Bdellovibrionales bacterium]MBT7670533.1 hypothetical protein [Bdellovibrionales bacterium]MBT7766459.1 hypothetical protein [Bdellovibrionales bacterium]
MIYILLVMTVVIVDAPWLLAAESCSRVATIGHQDVLVDINSTQKGAGLRYYLEKDPVAKMYLDRYQEGNRIRWQNTAFGTLGSILIFTGLLTNRHSGNRDAMLVGGGAAMIINFLVAKTYKNANERNLVRAIEHYNQRNLPRIDFSPARQFAGGKGIMLNIGKEF